MMKMKTVVLVLLMGWSLITANASFDGTVSLYQDTGKYSGANGGEFFAVTSGLGNFPTFCIEENEYFYGGVKYNYRLNTGAVSGGVSGANTPDSYTGLPMDNVSMGTAWLYSNFRNGNLTSYNYVYGVGRINSATELQKAIWYLEGETTLFPTGPTNFINLAKSALGMDETEIRQDSNGAFGVVAMNIFDNNGGRIQDQLAMVPVPEPITMISGMLLLIPFSLSTYRIIRRNHK